MHHADGKRTIFLSKKKKRKKYIADGFPPVWFTEFRNVSRQISINAVVGWQFELDELCTWHQSSSIGRSLLSTTRAYCGQPPSGVSFLQMHTLKLPSQGHLNPWLFLLRFNEIMLTAHAQTDRFQPR